MHIIRGINIFSVCTKERFSLAFLRENAEVALTLNLNANIITACSIITINNRSVLNW